VRNIDIGIPQHRASCFKYINTSVGNEEFSSPPGDLAALKGIRLATDARDAYRAFETVLRSMTEGFNELIKRLLSLENVNCVYRSLRVNADKMNKRTVGLWIPGPFIGVFGSSTENSSSASLNRSQPAEI
jgi:hypothetical protein